MTTWLVSLVNNAQKMDQMTKCMHEGGLGLVMRCCRQGWQP